MDNKEDCAICLQSKTDDSSESPTAAIQRLLCGHTFHSDCISHWFTTSGRTFCPICRRNNDPNAIIDNGFSNMNNDDGLEDGLEEFLAAELGIDGMFGSFETETGSVFVYESPAGIIMIQTVNVPNINIPRGLNMISLPTAPERHRILQNHRRNRRRGNFLSRFFRGIWRTLTCNMFSHGWMR